MANRDNKDQTLSKAFALPKTQCPVALDIISQTLKNEIEKTGITKSVIGLSGGIDSALSLFLAVHALGAENVTAVFMPYRLTSPLSKKHAQMAADTCKVKMYEEDLSKMADPYFTELQSADEKKDRLRKGNILARLRMIVLYDYSFSLNALVVGTSNKTESLLGYSTLWGDMASAVNPLGDLYKFQVYDLARHLRIPEEILLKAPSADLWEGQTDEAELNLTYDFIDRILFHWIDLGWDKKRIFTQLQNHGLEPKDAETVFERVMKSQYKRKMPLIIKVSEKTIDREFRYPRDWGM